jgi:hypothetical protein
LKKVGFLVSGSTPEELQRFTAAELIKWSDAIRAAGIEPQ